MSAIFVTNVTQFAGPDIIKSLVEHSHHVVCHDRTFADKGTREDYARETQAYTIAAQTAENIFKEVCAIGDVDKFIFNESFPTSATALEEIEVDSLNQAFQALTVFPFRLSQLFLPELKAKQSGTFAFITSTRHLQPEPGFAVASSVRAATRAFALALAKETAAHGIQVNTIQANDLVSDEDNSAEPAEIEKLASVETQEEFGELVERFISGRSTFTTGQEITFTNSLAK